MIPVYSVAQIRAVEAQENSKRGETSLMKQAASHLASTALGMLAENTSAEPAFVVALIGPGNNGGDGLYALAELNCKDFHAGTAVPRTGPR